MRVQGAERRVSPEGPPCRRGAQPSPGCPHPQNGVSCVWRRQGDVPANGCRARARLSARSARHAPRYTDVLRRSRGSWQGPKCQEGAAVPGPRRSLRRCLSEEGLEKDMEPGILSSVSPPSGRLGRGQNEISWCAVAKRRAFFTFPCPLYLFPFSHLCFLSGQKTQRLQI